MIGRCTSFLSVLWNQLVMCFFYFKYFLELTIDAICNFLSGSFFLSSISLSYRAIQIFYFLSVLASVFSCFLNSHQKVVITFSVIY